MPQVPEPAAETRGPWDVTSDEQPRTAAIAAPASGPPDPMALLPWMDDVASLGETSDRPREETAAPKSHRPVAEKRVADRGPSIPRGAKYDPRWVGMAQGSIREGWAPKTVRIPDEVDRDLDEAWKQSQADGNEHGGNIVRTYGGKYDLRLGGTGDPDTFWPDEKDVGIGQEHVGDAHTHPGATPDSFSDDDVANMADHQRRISLMRAAGQTHMLARTKEFDAMVAQVEKEKDGEKLMEDRAAFRAQMKATYNAAYQRVLNGDPKNHSAAVEAGTQAAASKYHLLYYRGAGAELSRVGGPPRPDGP